MAPREIPTESERARKFGLTIRRLRERRGISLREAARRLKVSPGLLSRGERGKAADLRKPGYVDRLAAVLDADVDILRKEAGLEPLDLGAVWLQVASLGGDLVGVRLRDPEEQHLARVLGYILVGVGFATSGTKEGGEESLRAKVALEEILRLLVLVVGRRPGGWFQGYAESKDHGVKALHSVVDAALAELYRVHEDDIKELLKVK